jgi:large subunit ribosomal protein L10
MRAPRHCGAPVWTPSSILTTAPKQYATAASIASMLRLPEDYVPPTKPPSARRSEERKAQLLRTYTSLLRSTPLMLMFQHNNLTAAEWAAIRRELRSALAAVPPTPAAPDGDVPVDITPNILLQVVRTRTFDQALKIVEFFDPAAVARSDATGAKDTYTHDLSMAAYNAVKAVEGAVPEDSTYAQLAPLMIGQVALVTFPAVSPQHLAAALSILSPSPPAFPAPTRKKSPGYHDPTTQSGLQKLLLIGGRIEGRVFDSDGVRWVGGIEGGLDGLRAQLVFMLQSAGLGLTTALEGASKSLWMTMESRRTMLEESSGGDKKSE